MRKIIIAIDGHSSTGKSTLAKQLAQVLGYVYVDTGAMYRAVTLYALRKGYFGKGKDDENALVHDLPKIDLKFVFNAHLGFSEIYMNGENIEKEIRTLNVSEYVSQVSKIREVRQKLVQMQQQMGKDKGIVMDGRDIGTVVFPEAELKIFMTASPKARATRRYKELLARGEQVSYEKVLENVQDRDRIDSSREHSPLKRAKDAVLFDNSDMGLEEQFERLYDYTQRVIAKV